MNGKYVQWWDVYCPYAATWCLSSLKKMKVGWTTNVRGQQWYLYINHFSVNSVFPSENSFNALTPGDNLIPVWSRLECSFSFVERPKSDGSRSKPAAKLQYHWNRFPSEFVQMFYDCLDLKVVLCKSRHVWHGSLHDTKKRKVFYIILLRLRPMMELLIWKMSRKISKVWSIRYSGLVLVPNWSKYQGLNKQL